MSFFSASSNTRPQERILETAGRCASCGKKAPRTSNCCGKPACSRNIAAQLKNAKPRKRPVTATTYDEGGLDGFMESAGRCQACGRRTKAGHNCCGKPACARKIGGWF